MPNDTQVGCDSCSGSGQSSGWQLAGWWWEPPFLQRAAWAGLGLCCFPSVALGVQLHGTVDPGVNLLGYWDSVSPISMGSRGSGTGESRGGCGQLWPRL